MKKHSKLTATLVTSLFVLGAYLSLPRGPEPSAQQNLPVLERPPRPEELLAYTEDGQSIEVNPPGFTWTPSDEAKAYRLEIWKTGNTSSLMSLAPVTSTVFALTQTLEPGEYSWRVAPKCPHGSSRFGSKVSRRLCPLPRLRDAAGDRLSGSEGRARPSHR